MKLISTCSNFLQVKPTYFGSCCLLFRMQKVIFVLLIAILLKLTLVCVDALQCVKCDSESRSCASPEIVDCTGKCFTYHSVDRVGGTLVSDLQKGCYPKEDVEIWCSCEACDTFQTMIAMFTDGEVDWSCKHHCCDDRNECNRHLHVPTCNSHSVYGF